MSIAGHVSRAMLSRYSHVRMEAKRHALDEIATRQNAADKKRKAEAEQHKATVVSQTVAVGTAGGAVCTPLGVLEEQFMPLIYVRVICHRGVGPLPQARSMPLCKPHRGR